jgi:hypothetical protein
MVVDHARYLTERRHRREVHAGYRRQARRGKGLIEEVLVLHDDDGSCCWREPWSVTLARIVGSLAEDGVVVAVARPDGLLVGNPDGEREAQELRERVERAAGGALLGLGPTGLAVRDRMLLAWAKAGGYSCRHVVAGAQGILMAHAADEVRCDGCWRSYAAAHGRDPSEHACDYCGDFSDDMVLVAGPYRGILLTAVACPSCLRRIQREGRAA